MEIDDVFDVQMSSVRRMLLETSVEEICKLERTEEFISLLKNRPTHIIENISKFMDNIHLYESNERVKCIEKLFLFLVDKVSAVDCFITFLEQLDEDSCIVEKFLVLLLPIKLILLKLSTSRGLWLEWTLSTIECYINRIPSPEDHEKEFNEKKIVSKDCHITHVLKVTEKLCIFYEAFLNSSTSLRETNALVSFGFHLLSGPIMYVYVENFTAAAELTETIASYIDLLTCHIHFLFDRLDERKMRNSLYMGEDGYSFIEKDSDDDATPKLYDKISALQLAMYYFTTCQDKNLFEIFPCVYDRLYLFHKLLFLSIILSKHTHNAVKRKGLLLANYALSSVDDDCIPHHYLDLKVHQEFIRTLSWISVHSYIFENRKLAVRLLTTYFCKFNDKGTYLLFMNVFDATNNSDVDGEIVSFFRYRMYSNFQKNQLNNYHKGKLLIDLLKRFSRLECGADTDLLKYKNLIISTLSVFVLILGRDVADATSIRDNFHYFEHQYFSVLKLAVNNARENLLKELNTLTNPANEHKGQAEEQKQIFDVLVEGEKLQAPNPKEKIESTKKNLTSIDMIEKALKLVYEYAKRYNLI